MFGASKPGGQDVDVGQVLQITGFRIVPAVRRAQLVGVSPQTKPHSRPLISCNHLGDVLPMLHARGEDQT